MDTFNRTWISQCDNSNPCTFWSEVHFCAVGTSRLCPTWLTSSLCVKTTILKTTYGKELPINWGCSVVASASVSTPPLYPFFVERDIPKGFGKFVLLCFCCTFVSLLVWRPLIKQTFSFLVSFTCYAASMERLSGDSPRPLTLTLDSSHGYKAASLVSHSCRYPEQPPK